jgi:competence protein ComEA
MIKKFLLALMALFAAAVFAAVDANKADQAALETVKGIGPAISGKIIEERKKSPFKDWTDMVNRVSGIGEGNAAKFSAEGLTVNGATFKGASTTKSAPTEAKKASAKQDTQPTKAAETKPAPAADPKASAPRPADGKTSAPKPAERPSAPKTSDKK